MTFIKIISYIGLVAFILNVTIVPYVAFKEGQDLLFVFVIGQSIINMCLFLHIVLSFTTILEKVEELMKEAFVKAFKQLDNEK